MPTASSVIAVDSDSPDPEVIARAGALLRDGGLVAFPTETVYGLGADARDEQAIQRIFVGKGRPATDPLIVHVPSVDAARALSSAWPEAAERLAAAFWPGPVTLVVPRAADLPPTISAGLETVALRVPSHPVASALLLAAGVPVVAPSANRFGRISPTAAEHVVEELAGVYDLLLDGGPTPLGVESTVVDLTGDVPAMLRPGGVGLEDLTKVLGAVMHHDRAVTPEHTPAAAPGELLRHYAPRTPLVLVEGSDRLVAQLADALGRVPVAHAVVQLDLDPDGAARELYSVLRAADASAAAVLLARAVPPAGIGRAVNDRLFRAAHGRVVNDASERTVERIRALLPTAAGT